MKILFIGFNFPRYIEGYLGISHVAGAKDHDLAKAFVRQGHDVVMLNRDPRCAEEIVSSKVDLYNRGGWKAVSPITQYDAIFLSGLVGVKNFKNRVPAQPALLKHPNIVYFDSQAPSFYKLSPKDVSFVRAFGCPTPFGVLQTREETGKRAELTPWGIPDIDMHVESPYPHPAKRVVFTGSGTVKALEWLPKLAADLKGSAEVWAAVVRKKTKVGETNGWSTEERRRIFPGVHFISDVVGTNKVQGHGPVIFGEHFPFLVHGHVGICPTPSPRNRSCTTKILDYLGAGLPQVAEEGVPNNGEVLYQHAGYVTPFGNYGAFLQAVKRILAAPNEWSWQRRMEIRRAALLHGGWDYAAWLWTAIMQDKCTH